MNVALLSAVVAISAVLAPPASRANSPGLAGDTVLIIRHAEKPADKVNGGVGLAPAGEARARAYANYFGHFSLDGVPVRITDLVATADSANSARPRLTLTPLSQAVGLPIQQPFADDQVMALADWIAQGEPRRTILIAWHHHKLPQLLAALGADPMTLIPGGTWPDNTYDWVQVLRYDDRGRLQHPARLVEPKLIADGEVAGR
jgi:hypothetical protein